MKRVFNSLLSGIVLLGAASAANATMISMQMGGGNPYWNDYDVVFGLGSTASPTWSTQVAWDHSSGDPFDSTGGTSLDITAQFNSNGGQTWWVFVDDNWGINSSYLQSFTIDTGSVVYTSTDTPIYIPDNGQAYAYIRTVAQGQVPEPGTLALLGLGLAGLGFSRRKRA